MLPFMVEQIIEVKWLKQENIRKKRIENEVSRTRIISQRASNRDRGDFSKGNISKTGILKP